MRDADLSTTHALINPQVDRSKPEAEQAMGEVSLHKVDETAGSIVVRGARMLATLAPFADDLLCYPGSDIRPQDGRYALAFVGKGYPHCHHLALELVDWGEIRIALDHLAQYGRWVAWGPLRHGLGRNLSAYVRIPEEELFVEIFCDMEQLEPDHEPRDWPDDAHSSNVWGILPPRSYFRFDRAAVEAERNGLEALGKSLPPADDVSLTGREKQ